jgi:hypothetical protein
LPMLNIRSDLIHELTGADFPVARGAGLAELGAAAGWAAGLEHDALCTAQCSAWHVLLQYDTCLHRLQRLRLPSEAPQPSHAAGVLGVSVGSDCSSMARSWVPATEYIHPPVSAIVRHLVGVCAGRSPTCRPGNSPQPKEAQPLSHALTDIRLIHFLDFSARGLVRRWLLIGHFLILYYPTCRARARLQGGVSRAPKPASPGLGVDRSKGESGEHQRGGGGDLASQSRVGRGHVHLQMDLIGSNSIRSEVLLLLRCYPT